MSGREITRDQVCRLAKLARLELSQNQVEELSGQLQRIVDNFAKVSEAVDDQIEPSYHPIVLEDRLRPDTVGEVLTQQAALDNAPAVEAGKFRVSTILGAEQ